MRGCWANWEPDNLKKVWMWDKYCEWLRTEVPLNERQTLWSKHAMWNRALVLSHPIYYEGEKIEKKSSNFLYIQCKRAFHVVSLFIKNSEKQREAPRGLGRKEGRAEQEEHSLKVERAYMTGIGDLLLCLYLDADVFIYICREHLQYCWANCMMQFCERRELQVTRLILARNPSRTNA